MTWRGSFPVAYDDGSSDLHVYDDGLVLTTTSRASRAAEAAGDVPAAAAAVGRLAKVIPGDEVLAAEVRTVLLARSRRLLVLRRAKGRTLRLGFSVKQVPLARVEALLRPLLGSRLDLGTGAGAA